MSLELQETNTPLAEISQGPNALEDFLDRHQKSLAALAILLVLAAIGLVIYRGIQTSHEETAGAALTKAQDLDALQAVVTGNSGTTAAASAMVLLANAQWTSGKPDAAISTLQSFISSQPTHPAIPSAKASLASKLLSQGKTADATLAFEKLSTDPTARFLAPFALISLADIAQSAGDLTKAETLYNQVKTTYPDSSFVLTATSRLTTLKAKSPTEIQAPAAPPAPTTPTEIPAPITDTLNTNTPPPQP